MGNPKGNKDNKGENMDRKTRKCLDIKTQYAVEDLEQTILLAAYMQVYEVIMDYYGMKKNTDEGEEYTKLFGAFVRIESPIDGIDIFDNLSKAYGSGLITKSLIKDYADIVSTVMIPSVYCSCIMTKKVLNDINTEDSKVILKYLTDIFNGYYIGFRDDTPALPPSKANLINLNAKLSKVKKLYGKLWQDLIKDRMDLPEVEDITLAQSLVQSLYFNAKRVVDATTIGYLELDKTIKVLDSALRLMPEIYNRAAKKLSKSKYPLPPVKGKASTRKTTTKKTTAKKEPAKKTTAQKTTTKKATTKKK